MATKPSSTSKWGLLEAAGITEDLLLKIVTTSEAEHPQSWANITPTYGILVELYFFANDVASGLHQRPNRILKSLVDALFPQCSVSRAD